MRRKAFKYLSVLFCIAVLPGIVLAQQGFNKWADDEIKTVRDGEIKARVGDLAKATDEVKARITIRNSAKQSEAPSISSNSTSLVDRSSASDIVGVALQAAGLATESTGMKNTSMSVTVSTYAFKAAAEKRDPLDPAFYNENRDWRRLSFTLGFDYPEGKEGDITERATIFGAKYLPYDKRDASDESNSDLILGVSNSLLVIGVETNKIKREIEDFIYAALLRQGKVISKLEFAKDFMSDAKWPDTLKLLSEDDKKEIDNIIRKRIDPFVKFKEEASKAADEIHSKNQIAFTFLTKQRRETKPDDYMVGAIFDLGVASRYTFTLNASFNYKDNKMTEDSRGGKFAGELQVQLNRDKVQGRMPLFLNLSGDGCWMTKTTPTYRAQAKVSIPLAGGIEIPLSITYASRTELIKEADVHGKVGFTFDIARIAQAFSGGLLGNKK